MFKFGYEADSAFGQLAIISYVSPVFILKDENKTIAEEVVLNTVPEKTPLEGLKLNVISKF